MRVLIVVPGLMIGGAERYIARVAPRLVELGLEVEVCALDPAGPIADELRSEGIALHGTSFARWTSRSRSHLVARSLGELYRVLRTGRFDVVHSYLYWADVLASLAGRLAGTRRIIVSRRALHWWRHPQHAIFHGAEALSNLAATELIANSRRVLEDTLRAELFVPRRRGVIYNGIEIGGYRPAAPQPSGRLRLLTVGALAARKGQSLAIEAMAVAGVDSELTLVGAGPDEPSLRALAGRLGVSDRVVFAGEHIDPRPHLEAADVFLLPSRQEGFSNALIEAMACSLPAIATDVGGNAEAIIDGSGGRIVPPEDVPAMAQAIRDLAGRRDLLVDMGRHNRSRCEALFTLDASVRQLRDWYADCGS